MKVEGLNKNKKEHKKEEEMNNNFLLISLEETKAKKIAEAINNATGRKILDALAKKDCTESELSKELNIPISTIHYNLKQLVDANLVVIEEFHYSEKGKEVNHYKLANKYIIIAPKTDNSKFMEALNKILPLGIITVIAGGMLTLFSLFTSRSGKMAASQDFSPMMAKSAESASLMMAQSAPVAEVSRPFLQSEMIAWFFIGALSITIIYFLYELVRKKK